MIHRGVLDTDTLSEILKGRNLLVLARATEYASLHGRFTFTAVSVLEVLYGLHHKDARRQLLRAEEEFADNEVIIPTLEDYKTAGRIRGLARTRGRQLTSDDCLIGAAAARLGLPVITGNTGHFVTMQAVGLEIRLEDWKQP